MTYHHDLPLTGAIRAHLSRPAPGPDFKPFYRVELGPETAWPGDGPYHLGGIDEAQQANQRTGRGVHDFWEHPGPCDRREYGSDLYAYANEPGTTSHAQLEGWLFGFRTLKQTRRWWSGRAGLDVMQRNGLVLAVYWVRDCDRIDGHHQAIARPGALEHPAGMFDVRSISLI